MKTTKIIAAVLIWAVSCAIIVSEVQAQDRPLENAFKQMQTNGKRRMTFAAKAARVDVDLARATFLVLDGVYAGGYGPVRGIDRFCFRDLIAGRNIGFGYLRLPLHVGIPPGFYTARVSSLDEEGQTWKGELVDRKGNVIPIDAEVTVEEVTVEEVPLGTALPEGAWVSITIHPHWHFHWVAVWHWVDPLSGRWFRLGVYFKRWWPLVQN